MILQFFIAFVLSISSINSAATISTRNALELAHTCIKVKTERDDENSAPILLLHGLGGYKESWMGIPQVLSLKTGRRVCAADLRNHGDSPWSEDSDIEALTSDLSPLLKTLDAERVILLGHSLGGKVAVHFALNNPDKVEKLIVEDMRPNGITDDALRKVSLTVKLLGSAVTAIPKNASEREAKLAVLYFMKNMFAKLNRTYSLDESNVHLLPIKCSEGKCGWKMNMKLFAKVLENPLPLLTESSGVFDKPTLFIYGLISSFKVGEDKEAISKLFPKAKLVGIEDADHFVHMKPKFLDEVITFINSST